MFSFALDYHLPFLASIFEGIIIESCYDTHGRFHPPAIPDIRPDSIGTFFIYDTTQ